MSVMTTGTFPKGLWPGVHRFWGLGYREHEMEFPLLFDMRGSEQAYEEVVEATGFGMAPRKPEGSAISYDTQTQGPTSRFEHAAYALGYILTFEEGQDGLYASLSEGRSRALGFSMRVTKETVAANVYNRATNASYTGGDGVSLLSTAHPTLTGNQANRLAVAADLSEKAIEDLITLIHDMTNNRGLPVALKADKLCIPTALNWEACRILQSVQQPGTANNDVNALRAKNALPGGVVMNHYFTDADQFFISTDAPDGMIGFDRHSEGPSQDNDFDTKNLRVARYERYSFGWGDWRGVVGSPGA